MAHPYKGHNAADHGKSRADKFVSGYKRGGAVKGGKTTININMGPKDVLPTGGMRPPLAPPVPPGPPVGGPPLPPGGAGPFARGGGVKMTAGAESGEGRLQKIKAYKRGKG